MRYEEFRKEIEHARGQVESLERAATREWVTYDFDGKPSLMIRVYVSGFLTHTGTGCEPMVSVNASRWNVQEGASTKTINGNVHDGGYFDHVHHLDGLNATQLRDVAHARELVDKWIAGTIEDLPQLFVRDAVYR